MWIRRVSIPFGVALLMLAGCATVDAGPDFAAARAKIVDAVGAGAVYDPREAEAVEAHVERLLAEGLTADEAVQVCLLNNPQLQGLFYGIGMLRADVVQSQLLANPSVGVAMRLPSGGGLANVEANLAQNIVDLWQLPLRKRRAERAVDQAVLELAHTAAGLAADTRAAYVRAVAAERRVEIAESNRNAADTLVQLTERLFDAGAAGAVDVNLTRSELYEAELDVRRARLSVTEARSRLAALMGLTEASSASLSDALPEAPEAGPGLAVILRGAAEWRLDIAAAKEAMAGLVARLALEQRNVFKVVEVGVSLERGARERSGDGRFLGKTVRSSLEAGELSLPADFGAEDEDTDVAVGPSLAIELPLFDQNQAQIAKAEYAYMQAAKEVQALLVDVTEEARVAHERAETAWAISRMYATELLPLRERNLELAREALRAGKIALIPVIEAQRTLQAARAAHVEALKEGALAWVQIERVTARPRERLMALSTSDDLLDTSTDD